VVNIPHKLLLSIDRCSRCY